MRCPKINGLALGFVLVAFAVGADAQTNPGPDLQRKAILADFGNHNLSRKQLLAEVQQWQRDNPAVVDPYMTQTAAILKRMVSEDEAHPLLDDAQLNALPIKQKVKELIFRLRDQPGELNMMEPEILFLGSGDKHADTDHSPAAELVRIGLDAVPQLLHALSDLNFTRAKVDYPEIVPRVGDVAYAVLRRIAARGFDMQTDHTGSMWPISRPGEVDKDRNAKYQRRTAAARAWWAEVQKKGEKQELAESIERGSNDAYAMTARLIELDPNLALKAVIRNAIGPAQDYPAGAGLLRLFRESSSPGVKDAARDLMVHGLGLPLRLEAARIYERWNPDAAVGAMEKECDRIARGGPDNSRDFEYDAPAKLIDFLVGSQRMSTIPVLKRALASEDFDQAVVLTEFASMRGDDHSMHPNSGAPPRSEAEKRQFEAAIEEILAGQLNQTFYSANSPPVRICDAASYALSENWPNKYSFDSNAPFERREVQRIQCLNIWRQEHGLKPVLTVSNLPPQFRTADRAKLPWLVREVGVRGITPKCGQEFVVEAKELAGKRLTPALIRNLLRTAGKNWAANARGFAVTFDREKNQSGFAIGVSFFDYKSLASNWKGWMFRLSITSQPGQRVESGDGGEDLDRLWSRPNNSEELADSAYQLINDAFGSGPGPAIHISIEACFVGRQ